MLGHPKVYINLDKSEVNVCGYCRQRFVAQDHKELFPNEQFHNYLNIYSQLLKMKYYCHAHFCFADKQGCGSEWFVVL